MKIVIIDELNEIVGSGYGSSVTITVGTVLVPGSIVPDGSAQM
jgi:hypothetical protein